jgi:membrane fusion protein (multidrug efflux system)
VTSGVAFDEAVANLAQADADVAAARAALDEARINLGYTEVRAPISGIIGGALVTEGALVTADGPQSMALIQQIHPAYADFTQSSAELLALKRAVEHGKLASPAPGQARVQLVLNDGSIYPHPGKLLFSSAGVDPTTGQVTLRAEFPNPKGDILPGLYVRIRIEQAVRQGGILVPQRAVLRTPESQAQVYVVNGDTAEVRSVTLGQALGSDWVVEAGLQPGERVIVNGILKVQPGGKIVPQAVQSAARNSAGSAAAAETEVR